jgi:uncharacterized protein (TIGR02217 family)
MNMQAFHDVRFPTAISFGATGGPERRTEIVALTSGREVRNMRLAQSRRRFDAGTGVRSLEELQEIVAFFEARRGSFHGFRFRDPFDMQSCAPAQSPAPGDQFVGFGDGANAEFQLVKRYGVGADAYQRAITKPVPGSVRISVGGIELAGPGQFSVDHSSGIVSFAAAPANGLEITAGFEFDVPARFDTDRLEIGLSSFKAGQIPTIPIIEIIEP